MLLAVAAACAGETVEVPGETVVVEKIVTETVEVPGETVVVEKEVIRTVEVPGETVTKEVVKEVMVPGETVVVEKEVVKTVEVPGQTVVVEKVVVQEVPGKKYVTDPSTGKVVSAPEYGGTLTFAGEVPAHSDTFMTADAGPLVSSVVEKLSHGDWALDRDVFAWLSQYLPWEYMKPFLAESWSQPDPNTIVIKIRQGVQWHDKPPMNGRELTAKDIEYNYHRYLGMGSGFAEASGEFGAVTPSLESIKATDKYTVVFKLGEPQIDALEQLVTNASAFMYPPEVIEQYGDAKDWKNLVGTGPFELVDKVPDTSITYVKSPNYWGYDEKYPENRLPYVDEIRWVVMPEEATRLAAMRSRKIDAVGLAFGWNGITSIDQLESLKRTNPEFQIKSYYTHSQTSFVLNTQAPPFDDVRVRHALQMAINLDEINRVFWQGYTDNIPQTSLSSQFAGYVVPYEDWPEETKQYYRYDPEGAEALLDAVGLKRGADGIRFSTTLLILGTNVGSGLDHSYLVKEYWDAIGIEVEHQVIDSSVWYELVFGTKDWKGIASWGAGHTWGPMIQLEMVSVNYFDGFSPWNLNDPVYDAMFEATRDATSMEEQQRLAREASLYVAEGHWTTWGGMAPQFSVTQPWVVGFNGETYLSAMDSKTVLSRLWIDSELKGAMGY